MTRGEFDRLVARLEPFAASQPDAYRRRVALLGALGYAYVFGVVAVLVLLIALLVWAVVAAERLPRGLFNLALALLGFAWVIVRSLRVRIPPPEGLVLRPEQAPALFELVEDVRRRVRGPRVHEVLVTEDFNAAIVQHPRLGVLGWHKNYLILGLPLLHALSPEQLEAVLAHEMGHLSGAHGRLSAWIYRIRASWYQLLEALEQQRHRGAFIFKRFFEWYAPYFGAYSFVLARAQEYEADRLSASVAGPERAAEALVATTVQDANLSDRFWPALAKRAAAQPDPPAPFAELPRAVAAPPEPALVQRWVSGALRAETGTTDTHPSLADRLAALGQEARVPGPVTVSAAQRLLGEQTVRELTEQLDRAWRAQTQDAWRERFAYAQEAQRQLAELDEKAARGPLTPEEGWQRAAWVEEFKGPGPALPLYLELLDRTPDDPAVQLAAGRLLLTERGDEAGIPLVERAMEADPAGVIPGCEVIHTYLVERGREDEARPYVERAVHHAELLERAQAERADATADDRYLPHGLAEEQVEAVRQQLTRYEDVAAAYLVRKELQHFPERPMYVLGVASTLPWHRRRSEEKDLALLERITSEVEFPGHTFVVVLNAATPGLKKKIPRVEGAEIMRR